MIDIKVLENYYFVNGYSVPYELKKGGILTIYPILVKDYPIYEWAKEILSINKNELNSIEIIQMTYLDFVIDIAMHDKMREEQIRRIFSLCMKENIIGFDKDNGKNCIVIADKDMNVKQVVYAKEFDDIVKIILNQNDVNYDDRYISKDVREAYEEYCRLKYKDVSSPSLEKMKAFVIAHNGYKLEEINDMTYRMFYLVYKSCVDSEIYFGQKIIQGSYKYDVKEDVRHPQYEKDRDPIADMFSDSDAFVSKIQQVNG